MKGVIINPSKKEETPVSEKVEEKVQPEEKEESVANSLGSSLVQARPMITPEEK